MNNIRNPRRVIVKEEIVAITGDMNLAIVLSQILDLSKCVNKDDDLKNGVTFEFDGCDVWMSVSANNLLDKCLLNISDRSMRAYLNKLCDMGFISSRRNPLCKFDTTMQYMVNFDCILKAIIAKGYDCKITDL